MAIAMACSIRVDLAEVLSAVYNHRDELAKLRSQPLAVDRNGRRMMGVRINTEVVRKGLQVERILGTSSTATVSATAATSSASPIKPASTPVAEGSEGSSTPASKSAGVHSTPAASASAPLGTAGTTAASPTAVPSPAPEPGIGHGDNPDDDMALEYIDGQYAYFPRDYQDDDWIESTTPYPIQWPMVGGMGIVAISFLWATASRLAPPNHKKRAIEE
jgi:hypothetical protein